MTEIRSGKWVEAMNVTSKPGVSKPFQELLHLLSLSTYWPPHYRRSMESSDIIKEAEVTKSPDSFLSIPLSRQYHTVP